MPPSSSPLAHKDIEAALDRALSNGTGVRIRCAGYGYAVNLRQRAYKLREIDRRENRKIYTEDDPSYGRSVYDACLITPREIDNQWYLVIEVSSPQRLESMIEDLKGPPSREEIEAVLNECNASGVSDDEYWQAVHEKLGLEPGELFPIMEREGIS